MRPAVVCHKQRIYHGHRCSCPINPRCHRAGLPHVGCRDSAQCHHLALQPHRRPLPHFDGRRADRYCRCRDAHHAAPIPCHPLVDCLLHFIALLVCVLIAVLFISAELGFSPIHITGFLFVMSMIALVAGLLLFLYEVHLATGTVTILSTHHKTRRKKTSA